MRNGLDPSTRSGWLIAAAIWALIAASLGAGRTQKAPLSLTAAAQAAPPCQPRAL